MSILNIDRSTPFNPVDFIGKGCRIEKEDERSLAITEIDLSRIQLVILEASAIPLISKEKPRRPNIEYVHLDDKILQTLWENKRRIPRKWKMTKPTGTLGLGIVEVHFCGTVFQNLHSYYDNLCVSSLFWTGSKWIWGRENLIGRRFVGPCAVLAPKP